MFVSFANIKNIKKTSIIVRTECKCQIASTCNQEIFYLASLNIIYTT